MRATLRSSRSPSLSMAVGAALLVGMLTACGESGAGADGGSASGNEEQACTSGEVSYGEVDEAVAASEVDEEALVVYSGRSEDLVGPLLDQFTSETGIELSVRYGNTAAMTAQLLEEGDQSPADFFLSQDAGALGALGNAGCLAALPGETLDLVEAGYRADDDTWVALTGRARVIAINPELVSGADRPASIEDVLDERWSGQVGIAPSNASFQAFITAIRVLDGEQAARGFLEGLVANDVQTYEGNGDVLAAVDSGEIAMGLINHYYLYELAAEVGTDNVNAENLFLEDGGPGSLVNISGVGVVTGTDRGQDAQALLDFMLSDSAQTYFAEKTFEYPMVEGIAPPAGLPTLDELSPPDLDLSDLDTLGDTLSLINEVGLT
ncbi:MAG: extracellular solute-binding protein, partial [Actinomycetota bacterium]|nr:extracellular solute-binding protein [Actinomycetota bacterium]